MRLPWATGGRWRRPPCPGRGSAKKLADEVARYTDLQRKTAAERARALIALAQAVLAAAVERHKRADGRFLSVYADRSAGGMTSRQPRRVRTAPPQRASVCKA